MQHFNLKEEPAKDANDYKKKCALNYTNSILRTRQKDSEFNMKKIIELISYSLGTFFASECYSTEMTQRMIFVVENYNHFTEQQLLDALVNYITLLIYILYMKKHRHCNIHNLQYVN